MKIYNNLTELVGNTPMLKLERYCRFNKLNAQIIANMIKKELEGLGYEFN